MNALFDSAALAIVAYAEVAADGSSVTTNSGVVTAKTGTGTYTVTLPADKAQAAAHDMAFVQVRGVGGVPMTAKVDDASPTIKTVSVTNASTLADGEFSILILRTVLP